MLMLQYVVEKDADTLLPQFLAMYRITLSSLKTHLVVMRSVFSPHFTIHCKYDLKATILSQHSTYRVAQNVAPISLYPFTSPDMNRFSKFFHWQNQEQICNKSITKDPITPQVCRYTTFKIGLVFGEVKAHKENGAIFGPPCACVCEFNFRLSLPSGQTVCG